MFAATICGEIYSLSTLIWRRKKVKCIRLPSQWGVRWMLPALVGTRRDWRECVVSVLRGRHNTGASWSLVRVRTAFWQRERQTVGATLVTSRWSVCVARTLDWRLWLSVYAVCLRIPARRCGGCLCPRFYVILYLVALCVWLYGNIKFHCISVYTWH